MSDYLLWAPLLAVAVVMACAVLLFFLGTFLYVLVSAEGDRRLKEQRTRDLSLFLELHNLFRSNLVATIREIAGQPSPQDRGRGRPSSGEDEDEDNGGGECTCDECRWN